MKITLIVIPWAVKIGDKLTPSLLYECTCNFSFLQIIFIRSPKFAIAQKPIIPDIVELNLLTALFILSNVHASIPT